MVEEPVRRSAAGVVLGTPERPVLVRWVTWREGNRGGYDSYLLLTGDGPVVVDPELADDASVERVGQMAERTPIATVLTNDMHERSAYRVRERWDVPVWAPRSGQADLEGMPDHLYDDATLLPGGLRPRDIHGRFSGDTVLRWQAPTGERVLFTGDTLCGAIAPENPANADHPRAAAGLYLGAGPFYLKLERPDRLNESLRPLLDEAFDLICGAHGVPVRNAKPALAALLDVDWTPLLKDGRHPYVPAG
jgi:glyoxylase-like metal-dependent hydrolase (beta-lactamase superfamily II)